MKVVVRTIIAIAMFMSAQILFAQAKLDFKPLANMNSDRYGLGYTSDGNNIYAVSGTTSYYDRRRSTNISNSLESYDIGKNKWTVITKGLIPRRYCNAEYVPAENKVYIFNGENLLFRNEEESIRKQVKIMEIVDLKSNRLIVEDEIPYPVVHAGSAVWKNKIYVFGGRAKDGYSKRLYEYDPSNSTWKRLPDMLEPKETSGRIVDGILYTFGGYRDSVVRSIDAYNIENSTWVNIGTLPHAVSAHATASDGQNVWLVTSYDNPKYLASYNVKTRMFVEYESNMIGRRHTSAIIINDLLYVNGGYNPSENTELSSTDCTDISLYKK